MTSEHAGSARTLPQHSRFLVHQDDVGLFQRSIDPTRPCRWTSAAVTRRVVDSIATIAPFFPDTHQSSMHAPWPWTQFGANIGYADLFRHHRRQVHHDRRGNVTTSRMLRKSVSFASDRISCADKSLRPPDRSRSKLRHRLLIQLPAGDSAVVQQSPAPNEKSIPIDDASITRHV